MKKLRDLITSDPKSKPPLTDTSSITLESLENQFDRDYSQQPTITRRSFPDVDCSGFLLIERLSDGRWLCARGDGIVEIRDQTGQEIQYTLEGHRDRGEQDPKPQKLVMECKDHVIMVSTANILTIWKKDSFENVLVFKKAQSNIIDVAIFQHKCVLVCDKGKITILHAKQSETIKLPFTEIDALHVTQHGELAVLKRLKNPPVVNRSATHQLVMIDAQEGSCKFSDSYFCCPAMRQSLRFLYDERHQHLVQYCSMTNAFTSAVLMMSESKPREGNPNLQGMNTHYIEPYNKAQPVLENTELQCMILQTGDFLMLDYELNEDVNGQKTVSILFDFFEYPKYGATPMLTAHQTVHHQEVTSLTF